MEHGVIEKVRLEAEANGDRENGKRGHLLAGDWGESYAVAVLVVNDVLPAAEIHENAADVFTVLDGEAKVTLGGTLTNDHEVKPGERQGDTIEGGTTQTVHVGDVISIPRGIAHQIDTRGGRAAFLITKINHNL